MSKVLVTGASGFIGMHLCESLLMDGFQVSGIDNLNNYYDVKLKSDRLKRLKNYPDFSFFKTDLTDKSALDSVFKQIKPEKVINLGAQAGVSYSLINPNAYIESNILGFTNILESCKYYNVKGLIYASSSSVYGGNKKLPFSENDLVDKPISIYAVSKVANELMAHSYNYLFGLRTTGLRFFTVYGPWGRPDMALYIFSNKICSGEPIDVFNEGEMYRDFTYVGDIVKGIKLALNKNYKYEIFNLAYGKSENIMDMIRILENKLGMSAKIKYKKMRAGDIKSTHADISHSKKLLGYNPNTNITQGISKFVDWYKLYCLS